MTTRVLPGAGPRQHQQRAGQRIHSGYVAEDSDRMPCPRSYRHPINRGRGVRWPLLTLFACRFYTYAPSSPTVLLIAISLPMKTERRHELQTNWLADHLGNQAQQLRPHAKTIAFGAVALIAAAIAYVYFTAQQSTKTGAGWADFIKAVGNRDVNGLTEVAKLHGGTPAGLWALQAAGDIKLASGAGTLYSDRKEAERNLKEAEAQFQIIEREATQNPMLLERAQVRIGPGLRIAERCGESPHLLR